MVSRQKYPNTKTQTPKKYQTSTPKKQNDISFGPWRLGFLWDLLFGIWNFDW
jgi:hypothetical protein